jgi:hypothetical protein
MSTISFKLVIAPTFIGVAHSVQQAVGLPLRAGPVVLFLTVENGPRFGATELQRALFCF